MMKSYHFFAEKVKVPNEIFFRLTGNPQAVTAAKEAAVSAAPLLRFAGCAPS